MSPDLSVKAPDDRLDRVRVPLRRGRPAGLHVLLAAVQPGDTVVVQARCLGTVQVAALVADLEPVGDFWQAEEEHQDHLEKYPNGYTCHFAHPGWRLAHRAVTGK